jgi:hypothetical protein
MAIRESLLLLRQVETIQKTTMNTSEPSMIATIGPASNAISVFDKNQNTIVLSEVETVLMRNRLE